MFILLHFRESTGIFNAHFQIKLEDIFQGQLSWPISKQTCNVKLASVSKCVQCFCCWEGTLSRLPDQGKWAVPPIRRDWKRHFNTKRSFEKLKVRRKIFVPSEDYICESDVIRRADQSDRLLEPAGWNKLRKKSQNNISFLPQSSQAATPSAGGGGRKWESPRSLPNSPSPRKWEPPSITVRDYNPEKGVCNPEKRDYNPEKAVKVRDGGFALGVEQGREEVRCDRREGEQAKGEY